jgi:hypothetical protein
MEKVIVPNDYEQLIFALENNTFDIVGLAEFEFEEAMLTRCLQTIQSILIQQRPPRRKDRVSLAQVLYAMVAVAREDYASQGHQELWPFLFRRIHQSNDSNVGGVSSQQSQSLLGNWFRTALEVFQYSVPKEGQTNIGPVVFHSGIPRSSLPGAMQVVAAACKQHGLQAETLPVDIRKRLVENFQPALHKPLQRLLGSDLQGASQLWGCLTRVVLAWQSSRNCSAELAMLPAALDPGLVREALPEDRPRRTFDRCSLSVLRYDVDTGEVRMIMPFGDEKEWSITSDTNQLKVHWDASYEKLTADFRTPVPKVIDVSSDVYGSDHDRTIHTRPSGYEGSEWPGIWFHAHNGNIEDGRIIDSAGLSAGRWYVLFNGTPTSCSVPFIGKTPLKWSFSSEGKNWNAFEIEIPPRTADTSFLEWQVGDKSFKVQLARRACAKTQFTNPAVATATTFEGNKLDVFAKQPALKLFRDKELKVLLVREFDHGLELVQSLLLEPDRECEFTTLKPGIYRICEARGGGQVLQRFAFINDFRVVSTPNSSCDDYQSAVFEFDWNQDLHLGSLRRANHSPSSLQNTDYDNRVYEFCTSQPFADLEWIWSDNCNSNLRFRFAIEGLRWKVTGIPNHPGVWTREPILLDPSVIAQHDAQLEIQLPSGHELQINDSIYYGPRQHSPSGDTLVLPLASYGELVELRFSGERYDAVVKSKQPILNFLRGIADQESIILEWEALNVPPKLAIVAWDPFDFQSRPIEFLLSDVQMESKQWELSDKQLPKGNFVALSLASVLTSGFKRSRHYAVSAKKDREPIAILIHRASGVVFASTFPPKNVQQIALALSLRKLHELEILPEVLFKSMINHAVSCDLDPSLYLTLYSSVESIVDMDGEREDANEWAVKVLSSLQQLMVGSFKASSTVWLDWVSQDDARFKLLLRLGIPLGQNAPLAILDGKRIADHKVYPTEYMQDLWIVSVTINRGEDWLAGLEAESGSTFHELQKQAATRILDFHRRHELPSPFEFLPLTGRMLKVTNSDCQHFHAFSVPASRNPPQDALDFAELLGLEPKSIDCNSTSCDQYYHLPTPKFPQSKFRQSIERAGGKKSYSLSWIPNEGRWFIENPGESPPLCCKCDGDSMTLVCQSASFFAERFKIRELINSWSTGTSSKDLNYFSFLNDYDNRLIADCFTGELHQEILKKPKRVRQECLGTVVYCDEFDAISDTARIAWQLSWLERWIAWDGATSLDRLSDRTRRSNLETRLPIALAESMNRWPQLMRRCLALAEIIYWTFHRQGIGIAAKFQ